MFSCTDPLSVPQRRETSPRKAKGRSVLNTLQNKSLELDNQTDDLDDFVDSDTDPAWTPQKVLCELHLSIIYSNYKIQFIKYLGE